ncbi:MAG: L,D-transpeptidase [Bacteriovorax sp.]|nr:L,D-transpeptidase [Bacteriovorax sp.]
MLNKETLLTAGLGLLLLFSSVPAISSNNLVIPIEAKNKILGVRISDIVSSYPSLVPGLANISEIFKKSPESFFNQSNIEVVHDIFLNKYPEVIGSSVKLNLTGFVKYKNQTFNFEKISVSYNLGAKALADLTIQTDAVYALKDMFFRASVGLIERKLIIEDTLRDIKLVFPIGVGAFDEGVMNEGNVSLVTPRFQNGFIDQRAVISKREKPRYFAGLPFIRILKGSDLSTDTTAIGFHIEINDSFVRGFDSHGCIRLRKPDLMAFHDLIMFGSELQTPITVQYKTLDPADHPAFKINKTFKTIFNKGSVEKPFFIYDRDNLVQMIYKENTNAPIEKLFDLRNDNYYDLFNYDTPEQMIEQDTRRKNECEAKVMRAEIPTDAKKFQECLDEGKRKDSFKDKLYRKFMGIDD